jgi:O-antigen ligase
VKGAISSSKDPHPVNTALPRPSRRTDRLHTVLFVAFGFGILLSHGLGTGAPSVPKWLFLFLAAASVLCWSVIASARRRLIRADDVDLLLIAFNAIAALSLAWSPDPAGGAVRLAGIASISVLIAYFRHCDRTMLATRLSLTSICAIAAILLRLAFLPEPEAGFVTDNALSETVLLLAPFAVLWTFVRHGPDRWLGVLLAAFGVIALLVLVDSLIEYGALATFAGYAAVAAARHKAGRVAAIMTAVILLAGLGVCLFAVWDKFVAVEPFAKRVEMFVNVGAMWLQAPIFGHGLGGFDYGYPLYQQYHLKLLPTLDPQVLKSAFDIAEAAHNEALQVLVETGLPGFAVAAALAVAALRRVFHLRELSAVERASACSLVMLAGFAMIDYPMHNPSTAAAGAAAMGIVLRSTRAARRRRVRFLLPRPAMLPVGAAGAAVLAAALVAVSPVYLAAYNAGVAHRIQKFEPREAASRTRDAYTLFPLSPDYRREAFATYVGSVARSRARGSDARKAAQPVYDAALSAGRWTPGTLVTRVRFLLLTSVREDDLAEAETILAALKLQVPRFSEIYVAEGYLARLKGERGRADAAFARAAKLRRNLD